VLFPTNRVRVLLGYFITTVPAVAMIGLWALIQFFNGFAATSVSAQTGGVAYMAHIGGFIAGLVLAFLLKPFSDRGIGPHVVGYPRRGSFS
jgi:membrane associated rhomboid family serine protease